MKRFCERLTVALFALSLAAAAAATAFSPREEYSIYENRELIAAPPELRAEAVMDGEYFPAWEDFLRDQIALRNTILRAETALSLGAGRLFTNGVLNSGGALLPYINGAARAPDARDAERMADELARLNAAVGEYGGVLLYAGVPNQYSALSDLYPGYMDYVGAQLKEQSALFFAALEERGVPFIDFGAEGIPARYYYATDHHITLEGGVWVAGRIYEKLDALGVSGLTLPGGIEYRELPNPFYGSRGRKLFGLFKITERLEVFASDPGIEFRRFDDGEEVPARVIDLPADDAAPVTYGAFMAGDIANTRITTDRPELPDALIVGDSYTNAVETVFYTAFDETHSLDLRHYDGSLEEYVKTHRPAVVVILRDDANYMNFEGNGDLR